MDELESEKRNTVCYIGMILIIIGYATFLNHPRVGDTLILIGTLTILMQKWNKWKGIRLTEGQSNTYSS